MKSRICIRAQITALLTLCLFLLISCKSENVAFDPQAMPDNAVPIDAPLIDREYQAGLTYPHYTDDFIKQSEKIYFGRAEIPFVLKLLDLKPGMVVGDIGCGVGAFAFPIAQKVGPTGKVYAIDIQAKMIDVVKKHMKDEKINPFQNVEASVNRVDGTLLPDQSLDIAWMSQVHFHNPPELMPVNIRMIRSIYRSIKKGGILVIGDEKDGKIEDPTPNIIRHYTAEKFVLEKGPIMDPLVETTFYLVFKKVG